MGGSALAQSDLRAADQRDPREPLHSPRIGQSSGAAVKSAVLLLLAPLALRAQLTLLAVNGTAETPVGATYQVGNVAFGDSKDTRLRARNSGTASVTISNILLSGAGFTIIQTPSPPFVIAPGLFQDVYVRFTGTTLASYSANLQIVYGGSSVTVLMLATIVSAPSVATLAIGSGCGGPNPNTNTIDF